MMIQSQGYRVSEARSGVEALALAERVPPAIAMVNAQLAQERDYWLLRGLRQVSSGARIYVLADVLSEEEGRQVLRRGASGYSETGKLPDLLNRVRQDKPPTSE
jgi:DNA-binding NarL/FixJ family response regulator